VNDTTLVTICAIVALAAVIVMLVALLLIRVMRFSVFGFATLILRMLTEPKEDTDSASVQAQAVPHIDPTDVRALTETLDFDAAVAKYRQEQQTEESDALIEPKPFVPDAPDLSPPLPNIRTPITGRVLRDGRFRRLTGGTPGRERDQDFRRPEGGDEPIEGA
jgi:hypothetical protein